jgi:hypothetical protein
MLRKLTYTLLGLVLTTLAALAAAIPQYSPSFSNGVLDVTNLNAVIAAVNNITGNGTPAAGTFTSVTASGAITSSSPSAKVGYATGAGCAVTQTTSRTTGVTCTGASGAITLFSAAGSATPASFTVTDTSIAATDSVKVTQQTGTDLYELFVTATGSGSFKVTFFTTGGTTTEQPVFNFAVLKGSAS